jgi:hypothetical protein
LRRSNWTPSIVPRGDDHDVYLVVDDLGRLGRVWREADYEATDLETVVSDLFTGQYNGADHVVSFNTAEGWSRDVSADIRRVAPALRYAAGGTTGTPDRIPRSIRSA